MNKREDIKRVLQSVYGEDVVIRGLNAIKEDKYRKFLLYYPKENMVKIFNNSVGRGVVYDKYKNTYEMEVVDYNGGKIVSIERFCQGSIYSCVISWLASKFNLEKYLMETYFEIPSKEFNDIKTKIKAVDLYLYISKGCEGNKKMYDILGGDNWEIKYDEDVECVVIQDPIQW